MAKKDFLQVFKHFSSQLEHVRGSLLASNIAGGLTSTATSRNSESCAPEDAGLIQGGTIASEDSDTQEHRRKRIRVKSPNKEDEDDGILEEGLIEGLVGRDLFPWRQLGLEDQSLSTSSCQSQ